MDEYVNQGIFKPGGIAFNFATNLVLAGEKDVSLVGVVGKDIEGKKMLRLILEIGVNSKRVKAAEGETPWQKISLIDGERKFVGYRAGVLSGWKISKDDVDFIAKQDVVFVPLSDGVEAVFETVKNIYGPLKAVDFSKDYEKSDLNMDENVVTKNSPYFDIIFIGGDKTNREMVSNLASKYPKKVFVLSLGEDGSVAFYDGKVWEQQAMKVDKVVDTTGCGDAFQATFLSTYLATKDIKFSLKSGSDRASEVIMEIGSTKLDINKDNEI